MIRPAKPEAYRLLHEGSIALARVEQAGMRIDVEYLERTAEKTKRKLARQKSRLESDPLFKKWKRMYGEKTKLGSRPQLVKVLVAEGIMKKEDIKYTAKTENEEDEDKKNIAADQEVLGRIDHPFVRDYLKWQKRMKTKGTYIDGLLREVVDGFIHGIFNLNTVRTFRSSMDSPNGQNLPSRDGEMAELVRTAFIPRKGHVLLEMDFKGVEVTVAAAYNKDPVLMDYLINKGDMHKDMASEVYMCDVDLVSKMMRYVAKNQFVFPQFYGQVYQQCAVSLWESILRHNLTMEDGTLVGDHLEANGIHERGLCDFDEPAKKGTFEKHLQKVENSFWGPKRFCVYKEWKDKWHRQYLKRGWAEYYTGFVVQGEYKRNEIINYPIQGSAFHCLLWCLTKLVKWLTKNKMRSKVICQIHDSMLLDVHKKELEDVIAYARYLMTVAIMKHWRWLIVPLDVESEIAYTNWFEKKELKI